MVLAVVLSMMVAVVMSMAVVGTVAAAVLTKEVVIDMKYDIKPLMTQLPGWYDWSNMIWIFYLSQIIHNCFFHDAWLPRQNQKANAKVQAERKERIGKVWVRGAVAARAPYHRLMFSLPRVLRHRLILVTAHSPFVSDYMRRLALIHYHLIINLTFRGTIAWTYTRREIT